MKLKKIVNLKVVSNQIYLDTLKNAGGSFSINKQVANKGYICAFKNLLEIPIKDFSVSLIEKLIKENYKLLNKHNVYFGTWIDNNVVYIDLSKNYKYKNACVKFAKKFKELAIFDLNTFTSIYI
jgi:hypothetical protein